ISALYEGDVSHFAGSTTASADATSIIITFAGNGTPGYNPNDDGGQATAASLAYPEAVAVDAHGHVFIADTLNRRVRALDAAGNLFIADTQNAVIREIDVAGNIKTVAGNHTYGFGGDGHAATDASLRSPQGVAVDAAGNLFIADTSNFRVREVYATTGL